MELTYDDQQGYIYLCGSDKKFMMAEFNNSENITEVAQCTHGYTCLIHDKPNERIFLINEGGVLSIFI